MVDRIYANSIQQDNSAQLKQLFQTLLEFDSRIDEFQEADLTPIESHKVKPPRILESPIHMECKLEEMVPIGEIGKYGGSTLIVGKVLITHVHDEFIWERNDGQKDIRFNSIDTVARLGGLYYGSIGKRWELEDDDNWNEEHW